MYPPESNKYSDAPKEIPPARQFFLSDTWAPGWCIHCKKYKLVHKGSKQECPDET